MKSDIIKGCEYTLRNHNGSVGRITTDNYFSSLHKRSAKNHGLFLLLLKGDRNSSIAYEWSYEYFESKTWRKFINEFVHELINALRTILPEKNNKVLNYGVGSLYSIPHEKAELLVQKMCEIYDMFILSDEETIKKHLEKSKQLSESTN